MQIARDISQKSNCKRAQVGCVIEKNDRYATGYNHNASGSCECDEGNTKSDTVHAEIAALNNKHDLTGGTAYVTRRPCLDCAKALADRGIAKLVHADSGSKVAGIAYLKAVGVEIVPEYLDSVQKSWDARWPHK